MVTICEEPVAVSSVGGRASRLLVFEFQAVPLHGIADSYTCPVTIVIPSLCSQARQKLGDAEVFNVTSLFNLQACSRLLKSFARPVYESGG